MKQLFPITPLQEVNDSILEKAGVQMLVKRDDLIHPHVSGNKWRKLKYNLEEFEKSGKTSILSFGGAFSNHIYSLAAAGKIFGFKTIGIIRGEKTKLLNFTLSYAESQGMELHFMDRETYRMKDSSDVLQELKTQYPDAFFLPEGGSNVYALPGCAEIVGEIDLPYHYICCAMGTGATMAGISFGAPHDKKVLGFGVLKAEGYFQEQVLKFQTEAGIFKDNWQVIENYHFGGYAKINRELVSFIENFKKTSGISLDPVYTGKLFYGIYDLISKDFFKRGESIVVLHSGGLQGLEGMKPLMDRFLEKKS